MILSIAGVWMTMALAACFMARGIWLANGRQGMTKILKPDYSTSSPPPPPAADPDELERLLWTPGDPAFWLDPDLWHGVGDTHRDFCWMHLDARRPPPPPRQIAATVERYAPARPVSRTLRDDALAALAKANDYEDRGFGALAAELRDDAMTRLRSMLEADKLAKQLMRPGGIICIPAGSGPTPVAVNGTITVIQHGVDVAVTQSVLEALRNSNVQFDDKCPKPAAPSAVTRPCGIEDEHDPETGEWIGSVVTFAPGRAYQIPYSRLPMTGARR